MSDLGKAKVTREQKLEAALRGIADADYGTWGDLASADHFVNWARSLARHVLSMPFELSPCGVAPTRTQLEKAVWKEAIFSEVLNIEHLIAALASLGIKIREDETT